MGRIEHDRDNNDRSLLVSCCAWTVASSIDIGPIEVDGAYTCNAYIPPDAAHLHTTKRT